jgi:DNA topoisomerase VI subunit A
LVIEKETTIGDFAGLDLPRKYNCIIITTRGQPDLVTRALLPKLRKFLDVPIYALVDPDTSGVEIYYTFKYGSQQMAHDNLGYRVPRLRWVGIYPSHLCNVFISITKII